MTGTLADAINTDVVTISIAGGDFATIYDIEYNKVAPRNRISTRAGKLDTYGPDLFDAWCSMIVDQAQLTVLETASTQNARRAYPSTATVITGLTLSGANDITFTFNAEYPEYKLLAPQGGLATTVRFHLIALGTPVVST
jgi:hypothetical protein